MKPKDNIQNILENIIESYYETDLKGNLTFFNSSFSELLGFSKKELLGMNYRKFINDEDAENIFSIFNSVFKTGKPETIFNWKLTQKGGGDKLVEVSVSLIKDKNGKPVGFRGIVRDLTEYKEIQSALLKSEENYFKLVESLPEVVFEINYNGHITYVNNKATELLGYSKDEFVGENVSGFLNQKDQGRATRGISNLLIGKSYAGTKYSFRKKDGGLLPVHLYIKPVYENNEIIGARGIAIDITGVVHAEAALRESEEKFRTIIESSSEIIAILDAKGRIKYETQSIMNVMGYQPEERINSNPFDLMHPEDREKVADAYFESIKQKKKHFTMEYRYRHKNGTYRLMETIGTDFIDNPLINGIVLNTRDITERKITEKALQIREVKYESLYNNALVGLVSVDLDTGTITETNDLGYKILGYKSKEVFIGNLVTDIVIDNLFRKNLLWELKKSGELMNREAQLKRFDGSSVWVEFSAKVDENLSEIKCVIIDITRRKSAEKIAQNLMFFDQLTELPNRDMFKNIIQAVIMKSQIRSEESIFAVICLGIDKFKNINDMYGQSTGDIILKKIAKKLNESLDKKNSASRFDGDKFLILFSEIKHHDDIASIVNETFNIFSDPFIVDGNIINISTSMGVCIYPDDGAEADSLIKNSESAMYLAKKQGRNTYHLFDAELNEKILKKLQLEKELQYAIINNEFIAYYQPKVNANGQIIGMESLIRWKSPTRGMVEPFHFIPLAENNRMIVEIGKIILFQSCSQNREWHEKGHHKKPVAVNLSPFQFRHPDLITDIMYILKQSGLGPEWLELEITESGIIENEEEGIEKLNELNKLGIKISIDDFGTGYSSLSKLKDYPIDTLKIDKSFIDNIPENLKSAALAASIIDLSHNLGFKVVAEGVETKTQLDFLVANNCDHFQGYYFSRPLPANEFGNKIKKN